MAVIVKTIPLDRGKRTAPKENELRTYILLHPMVRYLGFRVGCFSKKAENAVPSNNLRKPPCNILEIFDAVLQLVAARFQASVYKGYKRDKIEMRGDRAEISDFPLYLNTVAGGLDRRDQTIGGFSFVVKIYALPVVEIIGQLLYLLGRYGFNAQFGDCL